MFYYKLRSNEIIKLDIAVGIYEPREDSVLIAKVLEEELKKEKIKSVLEIGCGSGFLSIIAAKNGCDVVAADIDSNTVVCAKQNAELNNVKVKTVRSNLFDNLEGKFDLIVFNPPYLPEEQTENSRAWAGGKNLEIITRFIKEAKRHLESDAKILVVISSLSNPENILKEFSDGCFGAKIVAEQKIPWEKLFVISAKSNLIYLKKNYSSSISQ